MTSKLIAPIVDCALYVCMFFTCYLCRLHLHMQAFGNPERWFCQGQNMSGRNFRSPNVTASFLWRCPTCTCSLLEMMSERCTGVLAAKIVRMEMGENEEFTKCENDMERM